MHTPSPLFVTGCICPRHIDIVHLFSMRLFVDHELFIVLEADCDEDNRPTLEAQML